MPAYEWPMTLGFVGPDSPAVWNHLNLLQVDTILEAGREGMRVSDIAAVVDASVSEVSQCLHRNGLLRGRLK